MIIMHLERLVARRPHVGKALLYSLKGIISATGRR